MFWKSLKLYRDYEDVKEQAMQETVNHFESKNSPWICVLFLGLTVFAWWFAIAIPAGFEMLYDMYGFYPVIIFFIISYFFIFLGSKIIFKPTAEELSDDTSIFALFSACRRKERRSFISIGLSIFHTLFFVIYLIGKDF